MSWAPTSFVLLAVALAAGFAWYERTRPPARVVALVATLAALAALGRIAFAPLPNVKPTTDVVLIAGYALGGAPGFVVGATAALASNLFFGQGPWTPWQMAAWGLVGIGGAALARLRRGREPGRVELAAACGLAGLLFGAIMNVSTWVSFSGRHSAAELVAISGAALPFDIAHAAGNVVFALAFGPLLLRSLRRFRMRLQGSFQPAAVAATAAALLALALPASALAASPTSYLLRAQNADGGFGAARGARSDPLNTGWAALGLAAAGRGPAAVRRAGRTPLHYLARNPPSPRDVGALERTILVLGAAGRSPRRHAGRDLVAALLAHARRDGSIGGLVNQTAFGVLALRVAGLPRRARSLRRAARWLISAQNRDGGFHFAARGGESGVDDTAAPVQALVAAGIGRPAVARAVRFLLRAQNLDGGFPLTPGRGSNAQSSAWVVQALTAAGRDPARVRRRGSRSPLAYLRSLISPDGSVRYSRTSRQTPVWVTAQALMALERRPLPLAPS